MKLSTALSVLGASLLLGFLVPVNAAVRAWLDNNQVASGETVQLTLEHDGQTSDQPDLSPLKQDFDVLSTSRSSNVQIINGSMSSHVQLQLALSPKQNGHLTIPAISWGNDHSDPITLDVSGSINNNHQANGPANAHANDDSAHSAKVFVETSVDQAHPYVQAAVKVTVRVYTATPLYQAGLEFPTNSDVLVQQIGADQNKSLIRNGENYAVIERHYLVFPQRSGALKIPGAVLNAQMAVRNANDPFGDDAFKDLLGRSPFTSTKPVRVHGDDIALQVQPRPGDANASYWLPAHDVSVKSEWHPDQLHAQVGEPITVDLQLQADGLTAAQLPDLTSLLNLPAGIKAYPDQAKLNNDTHGDAIVGSRQQSIALIADQPGEFAIPALQVHWWDTQANQAREINLPARTLTITPAAGGATTQPTSAMTSASTIASPDTTDKKLSSAHDAAITDNTVSWWLWVSVGLGVLWIITLIAWYLSRRKSLPNGNASPVNNIELPSTSQARTAFQQACRSNDAPQARRALLAWINATRQSSSSSSLPGLRAFARQLDDGKLTALLLDLDRACYAGDHWNGAALLEALRELPAPPQHSNAEQTLASLYH